MKQYQQTAQEICAHFKTDPTQGLSQAQYQQHLQRYGHNEFTIKKTSSTFFVFLNQFADPLTYLLFGSAAIIYIIGQPLDAYIIAGILTFNGILGTIQERRTEKILHKLQSFFQCQSLVTRDGKKQIIENRDIVPGDIIVLTSGEKVPADARIISAINLTTDESALTGESVPNTKTSDLILQKNLTLCDQHNILFAGTYILTGHTTAVVYATGKNTQMGKIHTSIETIDTNTPLKQDLETLSHWILIFIIGMCASLFFIGLATGKSLIELTVMLTALFICVVPEGLPVVLTIIFISGAYKMAHRNVLVKRLKAIEALGRIDVIITDKTGTLTRNEMMINSIFVHDTPLTVSGSGYFTQGSIERYHEYQTTLDRIALACALLNDTQITFDEQSQLFTIKGNPTQAAGFILAQKINPNILNTLQDFTINYKIPFDAAYRYTAIFCTQKAKSVNFILGAPEVILPACFNYTAAIQQQLDLYLAQGYRIIVAAQSFQDPHQSKNLGEYQTLVQSNLEFLGLLAISDEPRENLSKVVDQLSQEQIQIIMATGDHQQTALSIAQKIGILQDNDHLITGAEFQKLNDLQVLEQLKNNNFVCARFLPQDKLRLVQILRSQGKIVATTGDGINDVPALVASDVSIAMGGIGTQLTKESADIILMHDSFENIIYAIHQGKAMFYALRRTILYFLISNASEVFIVFFALALSLPLPLLPSQILLLNLMTDGFLDAALAMEPTHANHHKMNSKKQLKIFDSTIMYKTLYLSLPASLISFAVFINLYQTDLAVARTLAFITLTMFQWFNALNCRSENQSVFHLGLFSNFWLSMATCAIFILQLLIVYNPLMHYIFKTVPLTLSHWGYAAILSSFIFIIEELRKYFVQRFYRS